MAGIDKTYISDWNVFDKVRNWAIKQQFTLKNGQVIKLIDYLYYPNLTKEEWDEMHDASIKYAEEHYNTPEHIASCKELYGDDWEFNAENYFDVILWNTPIYVDIWLIRNCPFEEIQNRLKEQYSGGWSKTAFTDHNEDNLYEQIKNRTSVYDTFQRNGLGKKAKVKFHNIIGSWCRDKHCRWWIEVNPYWIGEKKTKFDIGENPWYNENDDMWYWDKEAMPWTSNNCTKKGSLTKKNIVNLIKKWNLPKGSIVTFENLMSFKGKGRYIMHSFFVEVK